ncbi:MAG TPA: hypothetical protein VFS54_01655 [Solirubrobacterales bacterium]|nr:hypothetical protein [Solirubrobacterales bacterium]
MVLALASCGGDGKSDEEEIVEAIDYAFVSTDPDACTEQMTPAFSEQLFRDDAADAVESCEQNARAEESENDPVEVSNVVVDGSKATADVAFADAQAFSVALIEDDGDWKLDEVVGFVDFDRSRWMDEQREFFEDGEPWPARVTDCILDAYRGMSQTELEEMLLGGSPDPETEIISRCSSTG